MKNLAKLQLQQTRQKAKVKPMATARTARAVPQMRKVIKEITGRKDGGAMSKNPTDRAYALAESLKDKDRLSQKDIERAEKLIEHFKPGTMKDLGELLGKPSESESKKKGREKAKKVKKKFKDFGEKASGFVLEIIGRNRGGVIRPKPTFKGKVLKPKPIKTRGVGMAIRGFGKAFKKGK